MLRFARLVVCVSLVAIEQEQRAGCIVCQTGRRVCRILSYCGGWGGSAVCEEGEEAASSLRDIARICASDPTLQSVSLECLTELAQRGRESSLPAAVMGIRL